MAMQADGTQKVLRFQGRFSKSDLDAMAQFTVSQLLDQRIGRATVSATVLLAIGAVLARSWPVAIGGFLVILGISALVRYVLLPRRLIRHARQLPMVSGDRVITIDRQGIRHQTEGIDQSYKREVVRRMVLHKNHLFILLNPRGCLMLPLAWIQSPVTIEDVVNLLVRRNDEPSA